jgi:hypothetical protein
VFMSAAADTWVGLAQPGLNHVTEVIMSVGQGERSYVRFDLSSIPPGATVTTASLTLCRTNSSGSQRTHELRAATSVWTETGLTWNTQPALAAAAAHTITVYSSSGCLAASVQQDVQAWVIGAPNFGWRIADQDEGTAPHVEYATREEVAVGLQPVLSVTYTP